MGSNGCVCAPSDFIRRRSPLPSLLPTPLPPHPPSPASPPRTSCAARSPSPRRARRRLRHASRGAASPVARPPQPRLQPPHRSRRHAAPTPPMARPCSVPTNARRAERRTRADLATEQRRGRRREQGTRRATVAGRKRLHALRFAAGGGGKVDVRGLAPACAGPGAKGRWGGAPRRDGTGWRRRRGRSRPGRAGAAWRAADGRGVVAAECGAAPPLCGRTAPRRYRGPAGSSLHPLLFAAFGLL
ncbi:hypothetical protein U9M48_009434 [Paspalum notatum var. saurae]|uniref:Uncharacterized protein n=1 Tax=Paspalum notatum var. saurae TaxID=547442 RepID=A0AAQ3SRH0_PASNO